MLSASYDAHRGTAFAVMAIVFLCGAAAGGVMVRAYDARVFAQERALPPLDSAAITQDFVQRMGLSPEQAQTVQELLDNAIMLEADIDHRRNMVRRDTLEQIEILLNHEQRIQFKEWVKRPDIISDPNAIRP